MTKRRNNDCFCSLDRLYELHGLHATHGDVVLVRLQVQNLDRSSICILLYIQYIPPFSVHLHYSSTNRLNDQQDHALFDF